MKINKKTLDDAAKANVIQEEQVEGLYSFIKESNQKNSFNPMSIVGIVFSIIAFLFLFALSFSFNNEYVSSGVCFVFGLITFKLFDRFNKMESFKIGAVFDSISFGLFYISGIMLLEPNFEFEKSIEIAIFSAMMTLISIWKYNTYKLPIQLAQASFFLILCINFCLDEIILNYDDDLFEVVNLFIGASLVISSIFSLKFNKINKNSFQVINHFFAFYLFLVSLSCFDYYDDLSSVVIIGLFVLNSFILNNKSYLIYGIISLFIMVGINIEPEIEGFFTTLVLLIMSCCFIYLSRFVYVVENKVNSIVKEKGFDF